MQIFQKFRYMSYIRSESYMNQYLKVRGRLSY